MAFSRLEIPVATGEARLHVERKDAAPTHAGFGDPANSAVLAGGFEHTGCGNPENLAGWAMAVVDYSTSNFVRAAGSAPHSLSRVSSREMVRRLVPDVEILSQTKQYSTPADSA